MDNLSPSEMASAPTPVPASTARAATTQTTPPGLSFWRRAQILAAGLLCTAGVATAVYLLRPVDVNGQGQGFGQAVPAPTAAGGGEPAKAQPALFNGWGVPDLAILVSGEMHGFLQKCGCSSPQFGGLTRRYNLIESLRAKGWPLVAVDIGEIAQSSGPQAELKYLYAMKALDLMKYSAVGLGKIEFNTPLDTTLGLYSLNNPTPPVLATNLMDQNLNFANLGNKKFVIVDVKPQLGFFNVVDDAIQKKITAPGVKFVPAAKGLVDVMMNNRASVNIVMYQGANTNAEVGKFIGELNTMRQQNPKVPQVPIILALGDPEPPARPNIIGNTTVVNVGWKGRYVGVIGLFKNPTGPGFHLKYELVSISDAYDTPPEKVAGNKLMDLLEKYADDVEKGKYIARFPRGPHQNQVAFKAMGLPTNYVGSEACKSCHKHAYYVWNPKPENRDPKFHYHADAFTTLEKKAVHPSRRQFDGECVVCHTVGFQHSEGYLSPGINPVLNDMLKGVGCESCHGPGGAHVKNNQNMKVRELMNPYSTVNRVPQGPPATVAAYVNRQFGRQDDFCQKCHDQENDVNWSKVPFKDAWSHIKHYTPAQAQAPVNNNAPPPKVGATPPPPPPGIEVRPEK